MINTKEWEKQLLEAWQENRPDDIVDIFRKALSRRDAEIVEMVKKLEERKGKAIRVAEALGKTPTNSGPIASARIDGYKVALWDILAALKDQTKEQ